jgi:hypothetical protein
LPGKQKPGIDVIKVPVEEAAGPGKCGPYPEHVWSIGDLTQTCQRCGHVGKPEMLLLSEDDVLPEFCDHCHKWFPTRRARKRHSCEEENAGYHSAQDMAAKLTILHQGLQNRIGAHEDGDREWRLEILGILRRIVNDNRRKNGMGVEFDEAGLRKRYLG